MSEHDTKLNYLKQRPQTNLERLRFDLDALEKLVGSLRYLEPEDAKRIPLLLDQVEEGFNQTELAVMDLKGERAQWDSICLNFNKQAANFLRILGGREGLKQFRAEFSPEARQWWWFPDRLLSERRKSQGIRTIIWLIIGIVVLAGVVFLYQHYLAPDEATQTSLQHGFRAENLAEQGNYQAALDELEQAIEAKPDQPDLYLLKGVLAELLGKPEIATQAFQKAEAYAPDRMTFVLSRASEYLRFKQFNQAIEDAQTALSLDPQQASAYLILGQAYESNGDYQQALDNYRQADRLATEQKDAQVQVIARMSIGQLYNRLPALAPTEEATLTP